MPIEGLGDYQAIALGLTAAYTTYFLINRYKQEDQSEEMPFWKARAMLEEGEDALLDEEDYDISQTSNKNEK